MVLNHYITSPISPSEIIVKLLSRYLLGDSIGNLLRKRYDQNLTGVVNSKENSSGYFFRQ